MKIIFTEIKSSYCLYSSVNLPFWNITLILELILQPVTDLLLSSYTKAFLSPFAFPSFVFLVKICLLR